MELIFPSVMHTESISSSEYSEPVINQQLTTTDVNSTSSLRSFYKKDFNESLTILGREFMQDFVFVVQSDPEISRQDLLEMKSRTGERGLQSLLSL